MSEAGKEIGEFIKDLRDSKEKYFNDNILPKIPKFHYDKSGTICIDTDNGLVKLYPKADKVHLCKQNKWIKGVERWIRINLK